MENSLCHPIPTPGCPNWEAIMYDMSQSEIEIYLSTPYKEGNKEHFPLLKNVISNQSAKEKISDSFKEVAISEEKFDSEKIKGIYNDLFYQIPKKGKQSHTTIIEQSTDFVFPEINENLENSIAEKEETLLELNNTYLSGSIPQMEPTHPIYDNGTLVQQGTTYPDEPNSDIWYIQQGFKRKLGRNSDGDIGGYWHRLLRQAEGEEVYTGEEYNKLDESPNFRYLTPTELNGIKNGEDIDSGDDLNIKTITDQGDDFIYSEIRIELTCEGRERFYKYQYGEEGYDYDLSEYEHGGIMGGYWYLDPGGSCKVKTQRDIDPSADFESITGYTTIQGGKSKTITISRDEKFYTDNFINGTNDPLDSNFYKPSADEIIIEETRQGYGHSLPTLGVWKTWGEGKLFPSIIDVEPGSRLNYRLKSPYNQYGLIVDKGISRKLYAIIDGGAPNQEAITQGYPKQKHILTSRYDSDSNYGTRMIHKECVGPLNVQGECYGALEQSSTLQNHFNNPDFEYYKTKVTGGSSGISMYGQPILKINGKYCVFLYGEREGGLFSTTYWNVFINLHSGTQFYKENKHLDDDVVGYTRDSKKDFDWFINGKPNPSIYYPGLQGVKLNQYLADYNKNDNPFNPKNGGSNYDTSLITPNYNW
tara:strand:+ start:2870 stop:4804 length:1935 start_codon:yes stop_codon:yes gene_type:complete